MEGNRSFYHAEVGLLFRSVGLVHRDEVVMRHMVGGLGVLLLTVKALTIVILLTCGRHPLHGPVEITCLVLGGVSILAARVLRS